MIQEPGCESVCVHLYGCCSFPEEMCPPASFRELKRCEAASNLSVCSGFVATQVWLFLMAQITNTGSWKDQLIDLCYCYNIVVILVCVMMFS